MGIEAICVHIPDHFLDLRSLAAKYGIDPDKYLAGLGCQRMAVPHPTQDTVTMAASAVADLLDRTGVAADDIGLLVVGTETGVDSSKPVASYVHGLAGLGQKCRIFDIKHACFGATAGVQMACAWVLSGMASGRKAIVVASDIARYTHGSPGEPTQGAGAVAMLVSDRPLLLRLDGGIEAVHAQSVNDFWRPGYSHEAMVDGHYSVACYLSGLRETWKAMTDRLGLTRRSIEYLIFHMPFPRMAWKAYLTVAEADDGAPVAPGSPEMEREKELFERKVAPATWAAQQVGNIYTGSLWLALAALVEGEPASCPGKRISLFSYGSGSCSELITGTVGTDPSAWHGRTGLLQALADRTEIGHDEYVSFRDRGLALARDGSYCAAGDTPRRARFVFQGVKDHRRVYRPAAGWVQDRASAPRVLVHEPERAEPWYDIWMLGSFPPWRVEP